MKQNDIEHIKHLEELMKKYSHDLNAEPMRDEKGRITRIPESIMPMNVIRNKYGLPPIKKGVKTMETCRNRLMLEHPSKVNTMIYSGGCKGCPHDYGYVSTDRCVRNTNGIVDCDLCWDQPVETGAIGHATLYIDNKTLWAPIIVLCQNKHVKHLYRYGKTARVRKKNKARAIRLGIEWLCEEKK